jgi:hypothetical protein
MLLAPVSGFFMRGAATGLLVFGALCVCLAMRLSGVVLWAASRDLSRMGRGLVDPAGREATADARGYAGLGLLLGLLQDPGQRSTTGQHDLVARTRMKPAAQLVWLGLLPGVARVRRAFQASRLAFNALGSTSSTARS